MLNIISRSILFKNVSGPKKVVENLIKGLDKLGYPYVVNKRLDACKRLYIHDDRIAFLNILKIDRNVKIIAGPNIFNFSRDIPNNIGISRIVYLQPFEWAKKFWEYSGFNRCPLDVWATGIDIDEFKPSNQKKEFVLIYFKLRSNDELNYIEKTLQDKRIKYRIIKYNNYYEEGFKALLAKSRYIIWIGGAESQGIALQETLAANVPILIWDVFNVGHWVTDKKTMSLFSKEENQYSQLTCAEYFDERCGLKVKNLNQISSAIDFLENNFLKFQPRKYILENLSLGKKAKDLILLYEKHFGLSYEDGIKETLLRKGDWKNNKLYYIVYLKLKHFLRVLLAKSKRLLS